MPTAVDLGLPQSGGDSVVSTSRVNTEVYDDGSDAGVLANYLGQMLDPNADPMRNLFAARCPSRDFEEDYIPYQLAKQQIEMVLLSHEKWGMIRRPEKCPGSFLCEAPGPMIPCIVPCYACLCVS